MSGFANAPVAVVRQGAQRSCAIAHERRAVHQGEHARRELGKTTDGRAHAGIEAGILEQILSGDCGSDDIALRQRRTVAELGEQVTAHQLGPLLDRYKELSIDLVLRDRTSDLIEDGLDLEVRVGPISDSALIARRIGSTTAFLVAAPRYLRDRAPPTHPRDLQEHDCIVYHRWGNDNTWWFSSPEGELSVSVHGRFRADNAEAVRRGALDGLGIAILSHLTAQEDIRQGRLELLMPEFPPLRFPLSVVYPSRRNLPARTRIVVDFLTEVLRADPAMALVDDAGGQPTSRKPASKAIGN